MAQRDPTGQGRDEGGAAPDDDRYSTAPRGGYGSRGSYGSRGDYGSRGGYGGSQGGYGGYGGSLQHGGTDGGPGVDNGPSWSDSASHGMGTWSRGAYGQDAPEDAPQGQPEPHHHDPDYRQWRSEQLRRLDDDYRAWCQERYKKFSQDFDEYRKNRDRPESPSSTAGDDSADGK